MNKYKLIGIYVVVIAVVVGIGFLLFQSSKSKPKDLPGQTFENQGQKHIAQGSTDHIVYNSNPPTSGDHWPQPAAWGKYDTTLPDEELVHNLEHGGIWISYNPKKVDQATIDQLNDFAQRYQLIIVEPREKDDSAIALAAWTHLENMDSYDETTILKFITAYYNQGPEKVM
jgi:hypothetical protein